MRHNLPAVNAFPDPVRTIARQLLSVLSSSKQDFNSLTRIDDQRIEARGKPYSKDALFIALSLLGRFISTRVTYGFGWLNFSVS